MHTPITPTAGRLGKVPERGRRTGGPLGAAASPPPRAARPPLEDQVAVIVRRHLEAATDVLELTQRIWAIARQVGGPDWRRKYRGRKRALARRVAQVVTRLLVRRAHEPVAPGGGHACLMMI